MALVDSKPNVRAGVSFSLDRIEQDDRQITVVGCWAGVRGMRFVRPALIVGGRQALATLEHKPWAPSSDPWTAVFPWEGGPVTRAEAVLAVAPSVEVWLATGRPPALAPARREARAAPAPIAPAPPAPEPAPEPAPAPVPVLRRDVRGITEELERSRSAAGREGERAAAQRDEAVRDREAAVRTRARMERERDEALAAREGISAERDAALLHLEEVRAQRDEVIVAHRALRRRLDQQAGAEASGTMDEPLRHAPPPGGNDDEPLGVLAVPAGRTIAAEVHRADMDARPRATTLDLWAMRVFGVITAACFLGLLILLLRVFV